MDEKETSRPVKIHARQSCLSTKGADNDLQFRRILQTIWLKIFTGRQIYILV